MANMRNLLISPIIAFLLLVGSVLTYVKSGWSEWGEPVNLGPNVNGTGFDYYPSISSDETTLYYTSASRPGGYGEDDIWISTWTGSEWGMPVNAGPNVNWEWVDISPSISSDGTRLYFVSWGRVGGYGLYDIWASTWEDTMWGPAVNVGPNVNTAYIEWSVNISSDLDRLYFASDRPGSLGDLDIWVSEWDTANSEWGIAQNLGPTINTFDREYCPSISSNGAELYFARWGGGLGYVDIWVSQWEDTAWGIGANLGAPVNTSTWDNGPSISFDGKRLYFASGRDTTHPPAVQDIWVSEWLEGVQEHVTSPVEQSCHLRNFPNPFFSSTEIEYELVRLGYVTLEVYDATGRLVRVLYDGIASAGHYSILWDAGDCRGRKAENGVYFCNLTTEDLRITRKMILVR